MPESGWRFAAELSELKFVGSVDLPAMAYTYAALNNVVDSTAESDIAGFSWEGSGFDQVYPAWSQLRDELQDIMGRTSANVRTAGDVVLDILDAYVVTDAAAAESLHAAWKHGPPVLQHGEHPPPGEAPDVITR